MALAQTREAIAGWRGTPSMDPQHTMFTFDCRPMKAATMALIADHEAGRINTLEAGMPILALASTVPGLTPGRFAAQQAKLLEANNHDRARRLVASLDDRTSKVWVTLTKVALVFVTKWSAIIGAIGLVVWLVTH